MFSVFSLVQKICTNVNNFNVSINLPGPFLLCHSMTAQCESLSNVSLMPKNLSHKEHCRENVHPYNTAGTGGVSHPCHESVSFSNSNSLSLKLLTPFEIFYSLRTHLAKKFSLIVN